MKAPSKIQKQAICHLSGPAQVIAGPGSGKTYTIIQRILYLIKQYHIPPEKILVITYTKAAANEMKERYEKASAAFGCVVFGSAIFGTFHSICYNILRQSGGFKSVSLIKENDKRKLLCVLASNRGLASKLDYDAVTRLEQNISRIKNLGTQTLPCFASQLMPQRLSRFTNQPMSQTLPYTDRPMEEDLKYGDWKGLLQEDMNFSYDDLFSIKEEYDKYLREQKLLDFDDMITECLKLLTANVSVCRKYQQTFQYILADEFQDINFPQYRILKLLASPENNLLVVGDDDQAIYGFRGASPGIMKQFMEDYPNCKQMLLTDNYRSGEQIVELARKMIARNTQRFEKEFHPMRKGGKVTAVCFDTRKEEELRLLSDLSPLHQVQLEDTAIILRTNLEVMQYAQLLQETGIAVKRKRIKDSDVFHGFVMEDIVSFLSYLYEGNKRSDFIRFMNKPNRFISRSALVLEKVGEEALKQYYSQNADMLSQIHLLFARLKIAAGLSPSLAVAFFRKTLGYDEYLAGKAADYRACQRLMAQADQIQECFKQYKMGTSIKDFVEWLLRKEGETQAQLEEERGVSILTMHGAKGLEFERVFLPDVNDGIIPGKECQSPKALEEERRLLYVAITRAKEELFIYYTKERGRRLSRFLEGLIPPS